MRPTFPNKILHFAQDLRFQKNPLWLNKSKRIESLRGYPRYRVSTPDHRGASSIDVCGRIFSTDPWTNVPSSIISTIPRHLHLEPSHPISLTRQLIESRFPPPTYHQYNDLSPIVSVHQNFDSLGFPIDHPGRSRTDTYYINQNTVLRTHTSAHQVDTFRENTSDGYTISADVYRRDAIDRSHNPVFHQMEGARIWNRQKVPKGDIAAAVKEDMMQMPKHSLHVEDPNPTVHPQRNPLQKWHGADEVEAVAAHLKRSLEGVVISIFSKAREAALAGGNTLLDPSAPLQVRWVEAYFPFTSPSWELEVFWQGAWLELLGCGVVKQELLIDAGRADSIGWAFGIGLERVAMLLFSIPDIRLFWSQDPRFLSQFSSIDSIRPFVSFSKYPACYKDVAFWLPGSNRDSSGSSSSSSAGGGITKTIVHENDVMEIVREVAGSLVEDVKLMDEFSHPASGRKSLCYRVNYRSLERTLRNEEVNALHEGVRSQLVDQLGVELR